MTQTLWAPWRLDYIQTVADGPKECFLCAGAKDTEHDEERMILARGQYSMLLMNRYPYVNGHMLVAPYRHVAELGDLEPAERAEMMEWMVYAQQLLKNVMHAQGFNLGYNIGKCAGAGVPGHVHGHVVPRWGGDVNFISVVGNIKIIPQAVEVSYQNLLAEHRRLRGSGEAIA